MSGPTEATLRHGVRPYDAQRDGSVRVSGFEVWAQVRMPNGRKTPPVSVALCSDRDTAEEIAELLNTKYAPTAQRVKPDED